MMNLEIKNVSSLEKIMPEMQSNEPARNEGSVLIGEEFSYQLAIKSNIHLHCGQQLRAEVISDISDKVKFYNVRYVPVVFNKYYEEYDNNYISDAPGVFPDVLEEYTDCVPVSSHQYRALWVSVKTDDVTPGVHDIKIQLKDDEDLVWGESNFKLEVIGAKLPEMDIPATQWFHSDCIASVHGCEIDSPRHWELIDNYMKLAADNGLNMILTPVLTLALDTKVGAERPTFQLVDIAYDGKNYTFDFSKLSKWLDMAKNNGFKYIELSHLFSQWGAKNTPKVVVKENGEEIKKFGWHTDALSDEYKDFLTQFIPKLKAFMEENWDIKKVYFHISDEPHIDHLEHYGKLYNFVKPLFGDVLQMDALSDYAMYEKGFVDRPVVATTSINSYIENKVDCMWAYYCCGQGKENLSNRFVAMPSYRNRIMGIQMYKFDVKGFLQWGYNFYYSQFSLHTINPYIVQDAEGGFPAGDAFSVYPGANGAVASIRLKVFKEALQDMMALKLLESLVGKEAVVALIDEEMTVDFNVYPKRTDYILELREKVNHMIKENI